MTTYTPLPLATQPKLARAAVRLAFAALAVALLLVLAQDSAFADIPAPPLRRMTGANRARVLAALAGLIILGFGGTLLIWLGARITQRYRHSRPYFQPTRRPGEHDWARKALDSGSDPSSTDP